MPNIVIIFCFMLIKTTLLFEKESTYSLRGICMLMIIFSHICQVNVPFINGTILKIALLLEKGGFLGTSVFLLLSGYGCFLSFSKSSPLTYNFIFKRLQKILEPFVAGSFFVFIFCIINHLLSLNELFLSFISLSIAYEFPLPHPNTNMWFLKIIVLYYFISLFVFKYSISNYLRVSIISFAIIAICFFMWVSNYPQFIYVLSINFPVGMIMGYYNGKILLFNRSTSQKKLLTLLGGTLCIFLLLFFVNSYLHNPFLAIISSISFSISAILLISFVDVNKRWLYYIGKNSICFYIFHIVLLYPIGLLTNNIWVFSLLLLALTFFFVKAYLNIINVFKLNKKKVSND